MILNTFLEKEKYNNFFFFICKTFRSFIILSKVQKSLAFLGIFLAFLWYINYWRSKWIIIIVIKYERHKVQILKHTYTHKDNNKNTG